MIIYCEHISPRLTYIFDYVFTERLGIIYEYTQSLDNFVNSTEYKINYSEKNLTEAFTVFPEGLLFESRIRKGKPLVSYKNGIPLIYEYQKDSDFDFDIFSAIFFFLSRYEEYQKYIPDQHDRFPAKESLAFKHIFLTQPVVDHWVLLLKRELLNKFPQIELKREVFSALPTFDIDSPWCYRHKGLARNLGGIFRDLIQFQINLVLLRLAVLVRLKADPWYIFNWLQRTLSKHNQQAVMFILVGKYSRYDKTISSKNWFFRKSIMGLSNEYKIGIHPSYIASDNPNVLKNELLTLSKIVNQDINLSRQHYLKIKLPAYYEMLVELGISDDYSMGFADKPGFRAGTTRSFYWYNLRKEMATPLRVHPFATMDRTVNIHENQSVEGAYLVYDELIDQVKKVDGLFVTLWHNETFSSKFEWQGWKDLFEGVLRKTSVER